MYTAARWTPQGIRSVYTAESLALASLEVFVHTESDKIPLIAIQAFIPEEVAIEEIKIADLPSNWQSIEAYPQLQKIGKDWLLSQRTPVLKVPSAIVPIESSYILNPTHADLNIVLDSPIQFQFDRRMWKALQQQAPEAAAVPSSQAGAQSNGP
jgi:RES domain-containing protein